MQTRTEPASRSRQCAPNSAQIILGVIGLGTGAMYFGPAQYVARFSDAGIPLARLTSENIAIGIFMAGGLDWAMVNAYFSSKSIQSFGDYIGGQTTLAAKLGKSGLIILYVASQDFSQLLTSSTTSSNAYETFATIVGNTPGALFAGVGLMQNELPRLWSHIKQAANNMRMYIHDQMAPVNAVDRLYRARIIHYRAQQTAFINRLQASWRYISAHAGELVIDNDAAALDSIFADSMQGIPTTGLEYSVHRFGQFLGLASTVNYTAAFARNTFKGIIPFIPSLLLQLLAVAFLQSSAFYSNVKITSHGFTGLFDGILNLMRGKPVESLAAHLRPKTTATVAALAVPLSVFSYAVADFIFLKEFPGSTEGMLRTLRMTSNASMVLYHVSGLIHFYTLMLARMTPDKREQAFFTMENEVERLSKMTVEEFETFTTANTEEQNARYEIKPFENADLEAGVPPVVVPVAASRSWFNLFAKQDGSRAFARDDASKPASHETTHQNLKYDSTGK